jgi:hypothetical protein
VFVRVTGNIPNNEHYSGPWRNITMGISVCKRAGKVTFPRMRIVLVIKKWRYLKLGRDLRLCRTTYYYLLGLILAIKNLQN